MNKEDSPIYVIIIVALLLATWCIHDLVFYENYFMIILIGVNGWNLWLGLDALRLRKLRRRLEQERKKRLEEHEH